MITIKRYNKHYEAALFEMMEREGTEWEEYYDKRKEKYKNALNSQVFIRQSKEK